MSRALALTRRADLLRAGQVAHWELADCIGVYFATFGEQLAAARLLKLSDSVLVSARVALDDANWARHSPPPGAPPGAVPMPPIPPPTSILRADALEFVPACDLGVVSGEGVRVVCDEAFDKETTWGKVNDMVRAYESKLTALLEKIEKFEADNAEKEKIVSCPDGAELAPDGAVIRPGGADLRPDGAELGPDGAALRLDDAELRLEVAASVEESSENEEVSNDDADYRVAEIASPRRDPKGRRRRRRKRRRPRHVSDATLLQEHAKLKAIVDQHWRSFVPYAETACAKEDGLDVSGCPWLFHDNGEDVLGEAGSVNYEESNEGIGELESDDAEEGYADSELERAMGPEGEEEEALRSPLSTSSSSAAGATSPPLSAKEGAAGSAADADLTTTDVEELCRLRCDDYDRVLRANIAPEFRTAWCRAVTLARRLRDGERPEELRFRWGVHGQCTLLEKILQDVHPDETPLALLARFLMDVFVA